MRHVQVREHKWKARAIIVAAGLLTVAVIGVAVVSIASAVSPPSMLPPTDAARPQSGSPSSGAVPPPPDMPVGNLPGWKQVLAEDFSQPAGYGRVGEKYGLALRGYDGFHDTAEVGVYSPDSVLSVSDGALDFYLHTSGGLPRVASAVVAGYRPQTYGRYSVRFRSDRVPGYKMAFLLWPSSDDWNEGEIDWPEGDLGGRMSPASAIKGSVAEGRVRWDPPERAYSETDSTEWHIATTEWTPDHVRWLWDGEVVAETTVPSGVPDTPFRWTLQTETAGGMTPAPDVAGHVQVDWVVQYEYVPIERAP